MRGQKNSPEKNRWMLGGAVAALIAAAAVFLFMLYMEKRLLTEYERGSVCVCISEIPKGQLITKENMQQYFTIKALDKDCIAASALTEPEQAEGLVALFGIAPGVILTEEMFEPESTVLKGIRQPVIAGFKGEDLFQVVGGVLRAGDRIHIYSVNEENETELLWENVYVQSVFDQSGAVIANGDAEQAAQRINVYMEKDDVEDFYTGLAGGNLRVVKVCERTGM